MQHLFYRYSIIVTLVIVAHWQTCHAAGCPTGYTRSPQSTRCYKYVKTCTTFPNAALACTSESATLADWIDINEYGWLYGIARNDRPSCPSGQRVYTGVYLNANGQWLSSADPSYDLTASVVSRWASGQPNGVGNTEPNLYLDANEPIASSLGDTAPSTTLAYFCMFDTATPPPSAMPTSHPSGGPSATPATSPPSMFPSKQPTNSPATLSPTASPSGVPSRSPTNVPSTIPSTTAPSSFPSMAPTTSTPSTNVPSRSPKSPSTNAPLTNSPSSTTPSASPTSKTPSTSPPSSSSPSNAPTPHPSQTPSMTPSSNPTTNPSYHPSAHPTSPPSIRLRSQIVSPSLAPTSSPIIEEQALLAPPPARPSLSIHFPLAGLFLLVMMGFGIEQFRMHTKFVVASVIESDVLYQSSLPMVPLGIIACALNMSVLVALLFLDAKISPHLFRHTGFALIVTAESILFYAMVKLWRTPSIQKTIGDSWGILLLSTAICILNGLIILVFVAVSSKLRSIIFAGMGFLNAGYAAVFLGYFAYQRCRKSDVMFSLTVAPLQCQFDCGTIVCLLCWIAQGIIIAAGSLQMNLDATLSETSFFAVSFGFVAMILVVVHASFKYITTSVDSRPALTRLDSDSSRPNVTDTGSARASLQRSGTDQTQSSKSEEEIRVSEIGGVTPGGPEVWEDEWDEDIPSEIRKQISSPHRRVNVAELNAKDEVPDQNSIRVTVVDDVPDKGSPKEDEESFWDDDDETPGVHDIETDEDLGDDYTDMAQELVLSMKSASNEIGDGD